MTSDSDFPHVIAALDYAEAVTAGRIPACKWVVLACQRHLDDLERSRTDEAWPWVYDPAKGERICKFAQKLPHVKGRWASLKEKVSLQPWQCFALSVPFGWIHRETGLRRFAEVYDEIPRKNGKSLIGAIVGLYCFAADDEYGAEVYSGATSEKQAWEVFKPARMMALRTPALVERFGIEVNAKTLVRLEDASKFEPVIGKPGDGASPHCVIVDEFHEHDSPELYDTMITGMGARDQPMMFIITTAGSNLAGPCRDKHLYAREVLQGIKADERFFALMYGIDDDDEWTSPAALVKANPNYGVSVGADYLLHRQAIAMQSATQQNAFRTKHLNIWVGAKVAWMNMQKWGLAPQRKSIDDLIGRRCFIALDLASRVDVAAKVILFPPADDDPLWHVHGSYYLPEEVVEDEAHANYSHYSAWAKQGLLTLTPGNIIDFACIKDDLREDMSRFQVAEVPYDPWQAMQLATEMQEEGAVMVEVRPTVQNFSPAMKEVEALVLAKKLAHGDCPIMNWMMSNVVAKADKKDNIYPNKERPQNKIDGPVALFMAMARAMTHQDEKAPDYQMLFF